MNRNSSLLLWLVLAIGIVLVGGGYLLARPGVAPQLSIIATHQQTAFPHTTVAHTVAPSPNLPSLAGSASPEPINSVASSDSVPADWKTYRNTKYDFTISFPKNWTTSTYGGGEYVPTDGSESNFSIAAAIGANPEPDGGLSIEIVKLGSDYIGSAYQTATSLPEFLRLLSAHGAQLSRISTSSTISGEQGYWFTTCDYDCHTRLYFQRQMDIYEIDADPITEEGLFEQIVSTLHFY